MKILLISGHGDGDCGAVGCGYQEADLTREFVSILKPKLQEYAEVDVFNPNLNMYKYLKAGNTFNFKNYEYVFEVHFNSTTADLPENNITTGTEILVHTKEKGVSVEEGILKNIAKLGFKNRGVKPTSNLLVMNTCKNKQGVSHALLEVCFIKDADDMKLYQKKKNEIADAVVKGIADGFGLRAKESGLKDIKGHYAETYINDLYKMGIVKGDGTGKFKPDANLTRGDAAIMIRNAIKYITGK